MKALKIGLALLFAFVTVSVHAQNSSEVTDTKIPVTWLGVNFSAATYTGPENKFNSNEFKHLHAAKVNSIIKYEFKKFNLEKHLQKETVNQNTEAIDAINSNTDIQLTDDKGDTFTDDELKKIVSKIDLGKTEGVGVTIIVKSLNKTSNLEIGYIVYFDMASKNIIYSKQLLGKAKGFGMAPYWANPVLDMLKTMEKEISKLRKGK